MAFMADLACFDSATAMPPLLRIAAASWECPLKLAGLLIGMCDLQHCFRLILQLLMCLHRLSALLLLLLQSLKTSSWWCCCC